jgi:O-antigen/teichoic acid export membrane protein
MILGSLDTHTLEVAKKSFSSVIVKVAGLAAGFGGSIILGRTLGPEGLGIINLSHRLVAFVLVLGMLGMDNVIRKEIAIAFERKDWQHIGNVIFTSLRINLPIGFGLSLGLIFLSPWLAETVFNEPKIKIPLIIFSALLIPQMLSLIFAAGINGYRKVWQSNLVKNTLSSAVVAVGLVLMFFTNIEINLLNVALLYGVGRLSVTIAVGTYWRHLFRFKGKRFMQSGPMLKVALPLLLVTSTSLIAANADAFMLGWLSDMSQVGLYSVASRLGLLTNFFLAVTISTLAPKIASLYADGKIKEIEKMIQQITKGLLILGLTSVLVYALLGEFILGFWGEQFVESYWILIIITFGQFFNISTGSTGIFLMMTGHEKILGKITFLSVGLNITMNIFLIPLYGAIGAAIATATTVTLENIIKVIVVKKKEGIITIPFFN